MKCKNNLATLILLYHVCGLDSARILGVFLYPSKTHDILGNTLLNELASRGHEVTMLSAFNQTTSPPPNLRHIHIDTTQIRHAYAKHFISSNVTLWEHVVFSNTEMKYIIAELLEDDHLREFLREVAGGQGNTSDEGKQGYDVVISTLFAEALLGISHRVNATTIAFHPLDTGWGYNSLDYLTGNPHPCAFVPNAFTSFTDEMGFWQRFANTYINAFYLVTRRLFNTPMQRRLLRYYFPDAPPLEQLLDNVDLHLVNSYPLIDTPRPSMPNLIHVGGLHMQKPEPATSELWKYLDAAKEGLVLVTMGTNQKLTDLPEEILAMLFAAWAQSPHAVLVQYDGPQRDDVGANVRLMPWPPQRAVLSHPNTKAFLTHGGRASVAEAIQHGVPMIALVVPGHDGVAVRAMLQHGFGISLHLNEYMRKKHLLTVETVAASLREIVENTAYKKAISLQAQRTRESEMGPLSRAVYWIEHVAKYKNVKHLKSKAVAMSLWRYLLLDVVIVSIVLAGIYTVIVGLASREVYRFVIQRRRNQTLKHKIV